jgi:hypothetical protein
VVGMFASATSIGNSAVSICLPPAAARYVP